MLQADSNHATGEGEQESKGCGEGRGLQEGTLEEPSTVPLSDCTNRLSTVLVHQEEIQKLSSKGQWKQRARQLGRGLTVRDERHHNAVDKENLKRGGMIRVGSFKMLKNRRNAR